MSHDDMNVNLLVYFILKGSHVGELWMFTSVGNLIFIEFNFWTLVDVSNHVYWFSGTSVLLSTKLQFSERPSHKYNLHIAINNSWLIITKTIVWHNAASVPPDERWFNILIVEVNSVILPFNHYTKHLDKSYLGIMRFTVPIGKISIDFPQNLFFHLTSEKHQKWKPMYLPLYIKEAKWNCIC